MAVSGSYDWVLNRDQVITGALRKLGVLASGASATSAQISDGSAALNAIVKAMAVEGMPLWAITSVTFTVTSGTSSYTIGVGSTVNAVAPIRVLQAFYTISGEAQTPLNVINRYDFNKHPVNGTEIEGKPVNLYYQPLRQTGTISLWPVPDDSTTTVTMHYTRPFQDMDGATDDFDFPAYWIQALVYLLAWALAPEYGLPKAERDALRDEAIFWKNEALSIGTEEGSLYFQPAYRA